MKVNCYLFPVLCYFNLKTMELVFQETGKMIIRTCATLQYPQFTTRGYWSVTVQS